MVGHHLAVAQLARESLAEAISRADLRRLRLLSVGLVSVLKQKASRCESVALHEFAQRHDFEVIRRIELFDE